MNITDNEVKQEVIPFLKNHPEISYLVLRRNNVGFEGAQALAVTNAVPNITDIDLGYNNIGDKGSIAFANIRNNITSLNLECTQIGNGTIIALKSNFKLTCVNYDLIGHSKITGESVLALNEKDPIKITNSAKSSLTTAELQPEVPSLLKLCLYKLQHQMPDAKETDQVLNSLSL